METDASRNSKMKHSSTIALVMKVINHDIFKEMGEVGKDGRATGCEISIDCLGADEGGKLFNVEIHDSSNTYEEALKIVEELSCDSIHYIQGIFFLDSDEDHDLIRIYNPSYEPVNSDEEAFYTEQFSMHNHHNGVHISRSEANHSNRCGKPEEMIPTIISTLDIPKIMERVSAMIPSDDHIQVSISGYL